MKLQTEATYVQKMVGASIVKDIDGYTRHVKDGKYTIVSTGTFWPEDFANNDYGILNHEWHHFQRWGGVEKVNLDLFFKGNIPSIFSKAYRTDFFGIKIKNDGGHSGQ